MLCSLSQTLINIYIFELHIIPVTTYLLLYKLSVYVYAVLYCTEYSTVGYQDALNHRSQWSYSHPGWQALRVTSASPRNCRFTPLGFYWIPTYCLISVYRPVRAVDQFNHWLNSSWQRLFTVLFSISNFAQIKKLHQSTIIYGNSITSLLHAFFDIFRRSSPT